MAGMMTPSGGQEARIHQPKGSIMELLNSIPVVPVVVVILIVIAVAAIYKYLKH